jgi:signal transduction histidine kinase
VTRPECNDPAVNEVFAEMAHFSDSAGRSWLAAALVAAFLLCVPGAVYGQDVQRKVLVLYSTGRDAAISLTSERQMPRLLDAGLDRHLDYHAEYLDAGRFPDRAYQAGFRDFLRLKYSGIRFDLVIAILDVSIQFLEKYRAELFPDTPILFFGRLEVAPNLPNATGLTAEVDFAQTVRFARAVHPELNQVFVVSGAAARDKTLERQARAQFRQFEPQIKFTYLSGLATGKLEQRLTALPANSIVFYVLVYEDGDGQVFQPLEYLDRITAIANRPTYSWVDSTLGHGVVGGTMQRLESQIDAIANLALRVLAGESAESLPVKRLDLDVEQVDWRQLRRWGISEARLPAGTQILYRELGMWERYRGYILSAGGILLAQTALIVGLLVQAARRRRAEEQVRRDQEELQRNSERIRDLGGRLLNAQEAERSRIARELHDDVGQQMALLAMDLQVLSAFDQDPDGEAEQLAREALARTDTIAKTLHDLSHRLHPARLRLIGLVAALNGLRRELTHSEKSDTVITFTHEGVPAALPHDLTLCIFRVVQEALQNAVRHGRAKTISMHLKGSRSSLALTIVDDGVGFVVKDMWGTGLGLVSMTERLESIGGTLAVHSSPGAGACIEVSAPIAAEQVTQSV